MHERFKFRWKTAIKNGKIIYYTVVYDSITDNELTDGVALESNELCTLLNQVYEETIKITEERIEEKYKNYFREMDCCPT